MPKTSLAFRYISILTLLMLGLQAPLNAAAMTTPSNSVPGSLERPATLPSASHPTPQVASPASGLPILNDFQSGLGTWFEWGTPSTGNNGSLITKTVELTNGLSALNVVSNSVLTVDYSSVSWGTGLGQDVLAQNADWSVYDGFSFWFFGINSGVTYKIILTDNGGERLATKFTDTATGWKFLRFPWPVFYHDPDFQPGGAPDDGPTLTAVQAWSFGFPSGSASQFALDAIQLYGGSVATTTLPRASFSSAAYLVQESAQTAALPVILNVTSTETITVDYATQGGTAIAGVDYTPVSGTLTFVPGNQWLTVTVPVTDDALYEASETVVVSLTAASGATIGLYNPATLTLIDNDAPDQTAVEDFQSGLHSGKDAFNNPLRFSLWGSTQGNVSLAVITGTAGTVIWPGAPAVNGVLRITSNIENWGGFTDAVQDGLVWGAQDWSQYDGLRFWFAGSGSGQLIQVEIFDNRQLGHSGDSAERYYARFEDTSSSWRLIYLPFSLFARRTDFQPGGAPNDGLNLTDVSGYAFNLPAVTTTTVYYLDQVEIYGNLSQHPATARVNFSGYAYGAIEGQAITTEIKLNTAPLTPVTVTYIITPDLAQGGKDFVLQPLSGTLVFAPSETVKQVIFQTLDDYRYSANKSLLIGLETAAGAAIGWRKQALAVVLDNNLIDSSLVDDYEDGLPVPFLRNDNGLAITATTILSSSTQARPGQLGANTALSITYGLGGSFTRLFEQSRDWSERNALSFWYYGNGSGRPVTVTVLDNPAPDPGPSFWTLAWSDEFSGTAGAAPDPTNWGYDVGGGGYGNNEWEYYTASRDNSAQDGAGHLVLTATVNSDTSLKCENVPVTTLDGTCFATSARLVSAGKREFTYGRIEARIKIPRGQGIWPAFWMLGNDLNYVGWPQSGEIDIMENIGKLTEENNVYGTIHGPGYSGGSGIGSGPHALPSALADDFHVYAIEWQPTQIQWYIDGTNYFTATINDLPANAPWVFSHPFSILLNVAVGGNWPGYPDLTTQFPQNMTVDYVRVYQGAQTAERFEAAFVDNLAGWRRIELPFSAFNRSATQPDNAPNNGLTLTAMQGYQFTIGPSAPLSPATVPVSGFMLDEMRVRSPLYMPLFRR